MIFADVKLQAGDSVERLIALGLPLVAQGQGRSRALGDAGASLPRLKLLQPCAAFDGCRCRIYPERPQYCRQFECALLKRLKSGEVTRAQALRTIRLARRKVDEVVRLLRKLGDTDEQMALATRFRRTTKRFEKGDLDQEMAGWYGGLTLAMHELNTVLSEAFYPG